MNQILFSQTGEPAAVAQLHDAPSPSLPPGHVRLRMLFAPVNPAELKANFGLLAKQAIAEGGGTKPTPIVVTIGAEPDTPWEKVTNVLNAMTAANIVNVTFSVGEE